MRSESKTLKHSLKHWGIWLFILIVLNFCVIFWAAADGLDGLFDRPKIEETQEGSGDETDTSTESSSATEGETEATEFTEWIPVIRYPEGSIMIDSDEQKMMYFRNWKGNMASDRLRFTYIIRRRISIIVLLKN